MKNKRESERSESLHKTAKIVSGLLPGGGSVYELFTAIVKPLHEQRREEWVREVTLRLHKLELEERINLKELAENEEFNTIITKATLLAQQTHQKEKIEVLQNVVANSAVKLSDTQNLFDWTDRFLHIIGEISPMHILLLKTFRYPGGEIDKAGIELERNKPVTNKDLFFKIYPNLKNRVSLLNQCWRELVSYGFIIDEHFGHGTGKTYTMHTDEKILTKTTDFGNKFLDMIEGE